MTLVEAIYTAAHDWAAKNNIKADHFFLTNKGTTDSNLFRWKLRADGSLKMEFLRIDS
jgi:hypothetical protein